MINKKITVKSSIHIVFKIQIVQKNFKLKKSIEKQNTFNNNKTNLNKQKKNIPSTNKNFLNKQKLNIPSTNKK